MQIKAPYASSKLNDSTYLIVHNDKYFEFPYIYVKLYSHPPLAVVIDTGCGTHNGKDGSSPMELKHFIEHHIFTGTEHETVHGREWLVICTHCHFDHIGGIEAFAQAGAKILASGYDRDFVASKNRSANSLCSAFGTGTPEYEIDVLAADQERVSFEGVDLGLQILHTPGHTPDSLAIYDQKERWLFVGDTCYKRVATMPWDEQQDVPIILPLQGNWKDFVSSLQKLKRFVEAEEHEAESNPPDQHVRLAAGHTTADAPAAVTLDNVLKFVARIAAGEVRVVVELPGDQVAPGGSLGDETFVFWQDEGDPEFSFMAPKSFEKDFGSEFLNR